MTRVLFAFSDTGGGHRAAATALRDAVLRVDPTAGITMADPYAASHRWPFDRLAGAYPRVVDNASWLWRNGFRLTNTTRCTATLQALAWPALRPTFRALRAAESPDVIVSTHPLLTTPLRRVFPNTPLLVVVTDLVSGHSSWYNTRASLISVPTRAAYERALACGVPPQRVEVLGVPVAPTFVAQPGEAPALRARLGWHAERPTVLLMGGGDGVGPLESLAAEIDGAALGCDLAVVAGRNVSLAARLRARSWRGTVHVYEFVQNMGEMLRAASALVTKAGPGTISEACAAGCPLVLFGAIPGQETGNIGYVEASGAGVWAPGAGRVSAALGHWMCASEGVVAREAAARAALALARPRAAQDIARRVLQLANGDGASTRPVRPGRLLLRPFTRAGPGGAVREAPVAT
jgi:1,2-diacylglycerol 3-beta-galactosyltransferase